VRVDAAGPRGWCGEARVRWFDTESRRARKERSRIWEIATYTGVPWRKGVEYRKRLRVRVRTRRWHGTA
jgi:hypothetical protein